MRPRRTWSIVFLALLLASLLAACGEEAAPPPTQPPAATQVADAPAPADTPTEASAAEPPAPAVPDFDPAATYLTLCKSCHGKQREGFAKFPAVTPDDIADMSDEELLTLLTKGRELTNMRSFEYEMTPEEMQVMIDWLRSPVE